MTIFKINEGCKFRKENFGCILKIPINFAIKTGQTYYQLGELEYLILKTCKKEIGFEDILKKILSEYDTTEDEAKLDLMELLEILKNIGAVKEIK